MSNELIIIDKDYILWVEDLSVRYRQSQIRAAVRVNRELLKYYWELGRDIEEMRVEERWGEKVIKNLSVDLQVFPFAIFIIANNSICFIISILQLCHKVWHN